MKGLSVLLTVLLLLGAHQLAGWLKRRGALPADLNTAASPYANAWAGGKAPANPPARYAL
jgi:hypothetical protein